MWGSEAWPVRAMDHGDLYLLDLLIHRWLNGRRWKLQEEPPPEEVGHWECAFEWGHLSWPPSLCFPGSLERAASLAIGSLLMPLSMVKVTRK